MTEISPMWIPSICLLAGFIIVLLDAIFHFASQPLPNGIWYAAGSLLIATGGIGLFSAYRNQAKK